MSEYKHNNVVEFNEDDDNKNRHTNSISHFMSKKKSLSSLNKLKNKKEIDVKAIKNRKKLIYMLKCVIVLFYVCLFPLKTWSLGKMMERPFSY